MIIFLFIIVISRVGYLQLDRKSSYRKFYVNTLHAYYKRICIVKGIGGKTARKIPLKEIYNPNSNCDSLIAALMNKQYRDHLHPYLKR